MQTAFDVNKYIKSNMTLNNKNNLGKLLEL